MPVNKHGNYLNFDEGYFLLQREIIGMYVEFAVPA
jgi:hypothetical protein